MNKLMNGFETISRESNCDKHGRFTEQGMNITGRDIWHKCPKCQKEKKYIEDIRKKEDEAKAKIDRWRNKLKSAYIPIRFQDKTFDNFNHETDKQKNVFDKVFLFAENLKETPGKCLILCGKPGTGKTHLSVAACQYSMKHHGMITVFTTTIKAIRWIKDSWHKSSDITEMEAINTFLMPDLLVLDEVGVQYGSETEKILLFDILNARYESRKSTILISNLAVNEVVKYLGERIYDRLKEDGGECVVFDWESNRGFS